MEELLAEIDAFLALHNMTERDFGRSAIGDHNLIRDLRGQGPVGKPRSIGILLVDKVRAFMREYQPDADRAAA